MSWGGGGGGGSCLLFWPEDSPYVFAMMNETFLTHSTCVAWAGHMVLVRGVIIVYCMIVILNLQVTRANTI